MLDRVVQGRDDDDPLFLQIKEAEASVLEPYGEGEPHANETTVGRVVEGQRLTQSAERHLPRVGERGAA